MNLKNCIACDELISVNAKLCRHCSTMQNDSRFLRDSKVADEPVASPKKPIKPIKFSQPKSLATQFSLPSGKTGLTILIGGIAAILLLILATGPLSNFLGGISGQNGSPKSNSSEGKPPASTVLSIQHHNSNSWFNDFEPDPAYSIATIKFSAGASVRCRATFTVNFYDEIDGLFHSEVVNVPEMAPQNEIQLDVVAPYAPSNHMADSAKVLNASCN